MSAVGLAIALVFVFCGASAVLGLFVPERRIPLLLASTGSLAAVAAMCASAIVLGLGNEFHARLWTIPSIAALSISLDRLSAFFLLLTAIVILAS
jgi:formate hydrogenlyase subunit 3/multisubunit Na+/H+ antiporter MnhD subunit